MSVQVYGQNEKTYNYLEQRMKLIQGKYSLLLATA